MFRPWSNHCATGDADHPTSRLTVKNGLPRILRANRDDFANIEHGIAAAHMHVPSASTSSSPLEAASNAAWEHAMEHAWEPAAYQSRDTPDVTVAAVVAMRP
jgi:hypothetical protein